MVKITVVESVCKDFLSNKWFGMPADTFLGYRSLGERRFGHRKNAVSLGHDSRNNALSERLKHWVKYKEFMADLLSILAAV
jgi:hypothetical protein